MNHPMRRSRQQLSDASCFHILDTATNGTLSLITSDGYPYGVPISYARKGNALYFHCAAKGEKISAIEHCDKACFTVVFKDQIVQEEFTTYFQSVICSGVVSIVTNEQEKALGLRLLSKKYSPDLADEVIEDHVSKGTARTTVLKMDIEKMSGKEAIELVRMKEKEA